MDSLSGVTINQNFIPSSRDRTEARPASSAVDSAAETGGSSNRNSVAVTISVEGLKASSSAQKSGNSASNEAKQIEKIRERIKELQKQIQEQQAQLQAIQADQRLSAEEKTSRVSAINQQLASLNGNLAGATAQLMEALKGAGTAKGADAVQPLPFVQHDPMPASSSSS